MIDQSIPSVPSSIRPGELPLLHRLGEYVFQDLCCDLLEVESDVRSSNIYGTRGQKQHGIDILAFLENDGAAVGQCKCYESFSATDIRKASDEFIKHIERWRKASVRRFILFAACPLEGTQQQDEIIRQRAKFKELGIDYDPWPLRRIINKLRPQRSITTTYLPNWVDNICGKSSDSSPTIPQTDTQTSVLVNTVLTTQLESVISQLSSSTAQEIEILRNKWREGQRSVVLKAIQSIKQNLHLWPYLGSEIKAQVLCIEAGLVLELHNDMQHATILVDEADTFASTSATLRMRAHIVYRQGNSENALTLLDGLGDIDARNLQAAFLLELGHYDRCDTTLSEIQQELIPNAETFRICALLYLIKRDIAQAHVAISKALGLAPNWESILFTASIIDYWSILSSAALPDSLVGWPEPVDWMLVRRDDASLVRLRSAEARLAALCNKVDVPKKELQTWRAWHLACLANDPERQAEAIDLCRTMLQDDLTDCMAILWALARSFDINPNRYERALHQKIDKGEATITHVLTLTKCYLVSKRAKKAIILLDRQHSYFQASAEDMWQNWRTRALLLSGHRSSLQAITDDISDENQTWQQHSLALRIEAERTHNWEPLLIYLKQAHERTQHPLMFFEYCEVLHLLEDWDELANQAESLISSVATDSAVHLAIIGCYNASRYELCLRLLDKYSYFFYNQQLPPQLRHIRTRCKIALGVVQDAIVEAEALARDESTATNIFTLVFLYADKGDLKNASIAARRLLDRPDVSSVMALQASERLQNEDIELARALWRLAMNQEILDENLGTAIGLGFKLTLDAEMGQLMRRMHLLAHEGRLGFRAFSPDEFWDFIRQQQERIAEQNAEILTAYRQAQMPVHVVSELLKRQPTLVELYHHILNLNTVAESPIATFPILIRHGSRLLTEVAPGVNPEWRLHMDITAILLAAHIDILKLVETSFAPVHISAYLIPALQQMQEKLGHHQPSKLRTCEEIIDLVERGKIDILPDIPMESNNQQVADIMGVEWSSLLSYANAYNGYLVDFAAHLNQDIHGHAIILPDEVYASVSSCRSIADALLKYGPLSKVNHTNALDELGDEGRIQIGGVPTPGSQLVCRGNIPELLADARLLIPASERFTVMIEQTEFVRVQNSLEANKRQHRLIIWLGELIDQLRQGIDDGKYALLPILQKEQEDNQENSLRTPESYDLMTMLRCEVQESDVFWIDDRNINSYTNRDGAAIIGINDVLLALVGTRAITIDDYYHKLIELRAADVRFIPITAAEILYHLDQAAITEGQVVDTHNLVVLRRYLARCIWQSEMLQLQHTPDETLDTRNEIVFALDVVRTIIDSIAKLWATEMDDTIRWARADWIYNNLYITHHTLRGLTASSERTQDEIHLTATTLSGFITSSIGLLHTGDRNQISSRQGYLSWVEQRILNVAFEVEPQLISATSNILKHTLISVQDDTWDQHTASMVVAHLYKWFSLIPEQLREEMEHDSAFMEQLGVFMSDIVKLDDISFKVRDFYEAVQNAISGYPNTIVSIESEEVITFRACEQENDIIAIYFMNPVTGKEQQVTHPTFTALYGTVEQRIIALHRLHYWFDCSSADEEKGIQVIARIEDPEQRVNALLTWQRASAYVFYSKLLQALQEPYDLRYADLLPPSADGLLRHYRIQIDLSETTSFPSLLEVAATTLLQEEGLLVVIALLSRLPISLPEVVLEAVSKLTEHDQRALLRKLCRIQGSPLASVHFLRVLVAMGISKPLYLRLAKRVVARIVGTQSLDEWNAYMAIMIWVDGAFGRWRKAQLWPRSIRLAMTWAHAETLYRIFSELGLPPQEILTMFGNPNRLLMQELFERGSAVVFDCAYPRQATHERFVLAGLAYGLGTNAAIVFDEQMHEDLAHILLMQTEQGRALAPSLQIDARRMTNILGTFLATDREEQLSMIIGMETNSALNSEELHRSSEEVIETLATSPERFESWALAQFMFGTVPIYLDLSNRLIDVLIHIDYEGLYRQQARLGLAALRVASQIAATLKDVELAHTIKDKLSLLIPYLSQMNVVDTSNFDDENAILLFSCLDIVINCLLVEHHGDVISSDLGEVVEGLAARIPAIIPMCRVFLQNLCEQLSIARVREI